MGLQNLTFPSFGVLKGGHAFPFYTGQILGEKLLYHIAAMIVLKYFHIVTHCCAASFSIKILFVKLTTFSTANKTEYETKPNNDSESTSKIKVRSHWKVFEILVMSAVISI